MACNKSKIAVILSVILIVGVMFGGCDLLDTIKANAETSQTEKAASSKKSSKEKETEAPTVEETQLDKDVKKAIKKVKDVLIDPSSLQIHKITYKEESKKLSKNNTKTYNVIFIDYTAKTAAGGVRRDWAKIDFTLTTSKEVDLSYGYDGGSLSYDVPDDY